MKKKIIGYVHHFSKRKIPLKHIEEEAGRHLSVLKYSSLFIIAFSLPFLAFFALVRNVFYFDIAVMAISVFILANFFPDALVLLTIRFFPDRAHNIYKVFHSKKGVLLFSVLVFVSFFSVLSFQRTAFVALFGFLGYYTHIFVDKIEVFEYACCYRIKKILGN